MSTYGTHPDLPLASVRHALPKGACRDCVYRAATFVRLYALWGNKCSRCGLTLNQLVEARERVKQAKA